MPKSSTAGRIYASKALKATASIGVLALSAGIFYRVRELLAALLLFSVLFGVVIIAVLILWMFEKAAHEAAGRLEKCMAHSLSRHTIAPTQVHANHIRRSPPWS